jgi:hypothetical protein
MELGRICGRDAVLGSLNTFWLELWGCPSRGTTRRAPLSQVGCE